MSSAAERQRAQRNEVRFRALCKELERQDRVILALQAEADADESELVAAERELERELDADTSRASSEPPAQPPAPDRLKGFVVRG